LAMELSRASMKVARVTVMAMTQGLARGRQVSWNESVAAEASAGPFWGGWWVGVGRIWLCLNQSNGLGAGQAAGSTGRAGSGYVMLGEL